MADGVPVIPECKPGGVSLVSSEYANKIIVPLNAIMQGKVAPIAGVGSFKYAGGQFILDLTTLDGRIRALEAGGGGGAGNVALPFQINDTSPNANFASVNVRFGTVGGNIPAGIATDINLSIPNSNTEIYLNITIDNNAAVTAASINTGATPSPNTATKAYARIANVQVINNLVTVISQDLLFSQSFVACNRNTSDPATTPGTYFLQVS